MKRVLILSKNNVFNFRPFSPKQEFVLSWWLNDKYKDKNGIIADGSIRSGKTTIMSLSFVMWAMETFDNETFAMCGKTIQSLRRNVIKQLKRMLKSRGYIVEERRSENMLVIKYNDIVNEFHLFGGKDEGSQDLIQGITLAGLFMDEVALMPESFVNQACARCSVEESKMWFNCNPSAPHHYFKVNFIDKISLKNLIRVHFTMDDNPSLSTAKKLFYKAMYTGVFFKRFILGLWCATDGLVYHQFANEKEKFVVNEYAHDQIIYATIGVDFGGNKSAHTFTLVGFTKGYKDIIVLDEYYRKERITPEQLNEDLKQFVLKNKKKYKIYEAYCDSAEQTLIMGIKAMVLRERLGIEVKNSIKNEINNRISFYNSMMAQDRFRILKHCKNTIEALEQAVYDEKQMVKDIRLDNGTSNIDSLDSMEYATESLMDEILYINKGVA